MPIKKSKLGSNVELLHTRWHVKDSAGHFMREYSLEVHGQEAEQFAMKYALLNKGTIVAL